MQSEIDSLKQRISELEVEKVDLEAKNAELLKQIMEENTKREAENAELKARIAKLEQIAEENTELKDRITKLEQKQIQVISNEQEASPAKDISPLIESHSYEEKGITPDPLPEIEYGSTQPEFSMEPETSTTSLPQDIIHDDSAEILDFVETIHKERISSEIRERNREKKLQESHNNSTLIQSEVSTTPTPELKTVKKFWDQNQNKNQTKTSQSHKKRGAENIIQVIANGIQDALVYSSADNIISDSVTEISATARRQNSDTISLLDLAQLFDKATNAEYYAMKANQEETLCWTNYGKKFVIQYNDLIKNSNGKIGEKKAKGIIYDKILEHLTIIREKRSKEMRLQLPEISRKTLCRKTQRAIKTYKLFEKIGIDKIKYLKAYSANSISELTNEQIQKIIDNISNNKSNIENHMTEISTTAPNEKNKKALPETEASTITTPSIPLSHTSNSEDEISEEVSRSEDAIASKSLPETVSTESHVSDSSSLKLSQENNPEISHKVSCSAEVGASSNTIHNHAYFCNKILLRYSDLYKTFITEKFDYYDIIKGSLCPVCKLHHEDGKSVKGLKNHCSAIKSSNNNMDKIYFGEMSQSALTPEYLDWHVKLVDAPSQLTNKIRLSLYRAYTKEIGLDPRIKSETSESPQIEKDTEEKTLFVSRVNVQSIPSKRQFPISVLPKDPEERRQHVIEMVLDRFPNLTLKHSFRNDYFEFNRSVPCTLCNKNHKKENIRNHIEGIWGSGEFCGEKAYHLYCYINKYQKSIHIVSIKA
ncbi:hypothetical protein Glove_186g103 [Diversispora epigaea]|uniref:Uncharacterized protein n=1 Tax=Diversispora epigaea TaxID=1348612 RepID=A0A397IVN1_9GLOM|nr:hypothetical protein Glove_186g103 [Diversispora epigaea]